MKKEISYEFINDRAIEWSVKDNYDLAVSLLQDLEDTVKADETRTFLCANEIGYKERAFVIKFSDECRVFMNPVYQVKNGLKLVREYDPLTQKQFIVPRYTDVTICYQNSLGNILANKFNEQASIIVSQAMDCLDGIHPFDYGLEITEEFDVATDAEREEVIAAYLNELKKATEKLDMELREDEETKEAWDAFRFMQAKADGKVQTEQINTKLNRKQRRFLDKITKAFKRRKK